ncbi:MAG: hypothetical protein AB1649_29255, partial [Chloroflexota bacterium]
IAMQTQKRTRRITREGCFFVGLRISGWLLIVFGGLILLGGIFGGISTLFNGGSDLVSSLQYWEQPTAKFVFSLILTWLGVFAAIGCTGLIMIGVGFGLNFAATVPVASLQEQPIDKPLSPA